MSYLILIPLLLVAAYAGHRIGKFFVKRVRGSMKDLLNEIQKEKEDVLAQRTFVEKGAIQLKGMSKEAEKVNAQVKKNISTLQLLSSRINDPKWMNKFTAGRDNAPWN